jgi:hypothetical protein
VELRMQHPMPPPKYGLDEKNVKKNDGIKR